MIVILNRDVKGTGRAGDVVKVSDGYARNMLLPKGYATEATDANIRTIEKQKKVLAEKTAAEKATAQELANKLKEVKVVIKTKSGEGGKLFGSITSKDLSEALKDQFGISIDKKKFVMESPIKSMGTFNISLKLFSEVVGELQVYVTD